MIGYAGKKTKMRQLFRVTWHVYFELLYIRSRTDPGSLKIDDILLKRDEVQGKKGETLCE